jgi:signal transduction histidine kinase
MIACGEIADAAEGADYARIIVAQADRMTAIVRQLLDFARRRSGEKQPLDLAALARQTAGLLEPLGAKRGVGVSCDAAETGVVVRADAAQIQQALMNLVMNAIHASARGGGVSIAVRKELAASAPGRARGASPSALIEVSDTGTGISPEVLEQVFDPFFTTKAPGEGTGLGLSVAYGIAEEHGGWIDAESASQKGSRFRIWLPLELA